MASKIRNATAIVLTDIIASETKEIKPEGMITTDSNGEANIVGLDAGAYLLTAIDTSSYDEVVPTIVTIPFWNDEVGGMSYDVEVLPKHTPIPQILHKEVKKEDIKMVQTGDTSKPWLYILGLGFGTMLLVGSLCAIYRNRKR